MAAPSAYDEVTLAEYMHDVLGAVADILGWTVAANSYAEPVNEALLTYGVDAIGDVSGRDNIRKLRTIARLEVWRRVAAETAGDYRVTVGGETLDRHQIHDHAIAMVERAETDAAEYGLGAGYVVGVDAIRHIHDPYIYLPDEYRVIP